MEILSQHTAIEQLLAVHFGGEVRLGQGTVLNEREHVARFSLLEAPAGCPATVIAKGWNAWGDQTYDLESGEYDSPCVRLSSDWTGLQFLSAVMGEDSPAPRFIAGDQAAGFFVMEDIGSGIDPAQVLLGDDPHQAEVQMLALAAALGRMQAATAGQQADFERLRVRLGPVSSQESDRARSLVANWSASLEELGLRLPPGLRPDLDRVLQAVLAPGPFLAFTHGDPCPDNWRNVSGRMRLFDFESSGFRHALQDGVYGRIHFPTCWCVNRFPSEIPLAMERAYRAELVKSIPAATDDALFSAAVVEMCAFWVLADEWEKLPELMDKDRRWGLTTLRQVLPVRLGIFSELAASAGHLQALGETAAALRAFLRARWPQEADAMPLYPAFRAKNPLDKFAS
jgi:hypothetical protein